MTLRRIILTRGEESISLGSEEDEHDVEPFIIPPAGEPVDVGGMSSRSPNPSASMELHESCHHMARSPHRHHHVSLQGKEAPQS